MRARRPGTVRRSGAAAIGIAAPIVVSAVLGLLACRADEPAGPIRLIDRLDEARIETPLEELAAWETIQANLVESPYWRPQLSPGRLVSNQCRAAGNSLIECAPGEERRFSVGFKVPTEPYSFYSITLRTRAVKGKCGNLRLSDLQEARTVRLARQADKWQSISELWRTGGVSDTLRIRISGHCPTTIDSLEIRRQMVGGDEELSELAARSVDPFADTGLGMAKFGSLLPHRDAETVAPPFDENWGFREAVLAPAPTDITYTVAVPRQGRLRFSYAMSDMSRIGDETRFEVLAGDPGATAATLWAEQLTLAPSNWHWHEATVDLDSFAGRTVELTLRTRTGGERGYGLWGTPTIDRPRGPEEPPSIVLIAVDTLRADRLSGYGYGKPTSPRLDALARDGTLFLNPISASTQTPPAFASLFTGHLVARHGFLFATSKLAPNVPTLARVLRQNGWTTHAAAFHAALYDQSLARGFERYFNLPRTEHRADQNLAKGLDWLEANGDRRFFFFLHFSDPHQPFTQPAEFVQEETAAGLARYGVELPFRVRGPLGGCELCEAEGGIPDGFKQLVRDLYDEEVNYVDDQIGVFLEALADRGLYDDTIIAFVSDHGETLWDHFDYFEHGGINQHDELTRVPLIIKPAAGGGYAAGSVVRTQVRSFDLMPTLLEMVGIDASPLAMDARSLAPLLKEESGAAGSDDLWAISSNFEAASLRGRGWKWIWSRQSGEGLFDLEADPLETSNVAAQNPTVLRGMRSRYMETVMESAGGRYLLVLGDPEAPPERLRIRTPGAASWRAKYVDTVGKRRTGEPESQSALYEGEPLVGNLVVFAKLPPSSEPPVVEVAAATEDGEASGGEVIDLEAVSFESGAISRLLAAGIPGAYLIEVPLRSSNAEDEDSSRLDAAQEKALRALGYIE